MTPQLLIEVDNQIVEAMDSLYGEGSFEKWYERLRESIPAAWLSTAPPVVLVLSEELQDEMMTEEDREEISRLNFDEDGRVTLNDTTIEVSQCPEQPPSTSIQVNAWVTGAPDREDLQ